MIDVNAEREMYRRLRGVHKDKQQTKLQSFTNEAGMRLKR